MAQNAHTQSSYQLRKLPRCSKCKGEFILVAARYETNTGSVLEWEWECTKPGCGKIVPARRLKEQDANEFESFLHDWCQREHAKDKRRNHTDSRKHK